MFEKGRTLYTHDGRTVEFDHMHDDQAYVRPILTTVVQCTNYSGDDFSEEEIDEAASHLILVDKNTLSITPPVAKLDELIAEKKAELKALEEDKCKTLKEKADAVMKANRKLQKAESDFDRWKNKYGIFTDLGRMLDGENMYPIKVSNNPYHKGPGIPYIPEWKDIEYFVVKHNSVNGEDRWNFKKAQSDSSWTLKFFYSEEERTACIEEQFNILCEHFRKKPDFTPTDVYYSTRRDYRTLQEWCKTYTFLRIPGDIVMMKVEHTREAKEAERRALKKKLEEMSDG